MWFCDEWFLGFLLDFMMTKIDVTQVWQLVLDDLRHDFDIKNDTKKINEIKMLLVPLKVEQSNDVLELMAINDVFVAQIQERFLEKITPLVKKHTDGLLTKVLVKAIPFVIQQKNTDDENNKKIDKKNKISAESKVEQSSVLNPLFTFENFVKGKSNTLAYNMCYEFTKKGADAVYNSLFLYGSSGFGKTHLIQAVAHRYQKAGRSFCYFGSEHFVRQVVGAFKGKKIDEFVKNVSEADLLIIDDVHIIKSDNMKHTADILLSLYDEFNRPGKCIILVSDKTPTQLEGFSSRFISRFSSGLTIAIDPPEMDMRVQILQKKAMMFYGLDLPKECAIFIAQNMPANVRALEGAVKKVFASSSLNGGVIDINLVKLALKDQIVARTQALNADNIKAVVAEYYGISVKDIMGKKRSRNIARPRQVAMALTRQFTNDSYPDIGQAFGGRDHSTVMHACDKVNELREEDPVFDRDYQTLSATLGFV